MNKGNLIVIEGSCDGIGKTTQFNLLKDHLKKDNIEISTHHFPTYNHYQAIPTEMYLEGKYGSPKELSPYFINSLYAMDRAITWQTELKEEYLKGKTIILDRYTTSSLIYQSALIEDLNQKKDFINYVLDFEYNKLKIKEPGKIIFLYAPFDLVTKQRKERNQNEGIINDIHEQNIDYLKKVYENSIFIADYLNWSKVKCNNKNKMKSINEIHEEVYKLVKKR